MFRKTALFEGYLDGKGLAFAELPALEGTDALEVVLAGSLVDEIRVTLTVDRGGEAAHIRIPLVTSVPGEARARMLEAVNAQNDSYYYARFVLVGAGDDASVEMRGDLSLLNVPDGSVGDCCGEMVFRMQSICDPAYRSFMRALYA